MAVHRVRRTKLDTRSLADSRRPAFLACRSWSRRAPSSGRPQRRAPRTVDFARLVVNKPWGRDTFFTAIVSPVSGRSISGGREKLHCIAILPRRRD